MDESNDFELIVSDLDAETGVRPFIHRHGALAGWWSSVRVGRWLALAGIILFTVSLTQAWADFPSASPTPGPVHILGALMFHDAQIDPLTYAIFFGVPLAGFYWWALMWHPQFSRGVARLFPLWALAATAIFGYLCYLFSTMPVTFPAVGFWMAAAALFLIWNAVLVLIRARSHIADVAIPPAISTGRRQLIGVQWKWPAG